MGDLPWENTALVWLAIEAQRHSDWNTLKAWSRIAWYAEVQAMERGAEWVGPPDVRQAIRRYVIEGALITQEGEV